MMIYSLIYSYDDGRCAVFAGEICLVELQLIVFIVVVVIAFPFEGFLLRMRNGELGSLGVIVFTSLYLNF